MPNLPGPPVMHQPQQQTQNHGGDKDDKKDKTKRLGQACGACRKRKVGTILRIIVPISKRLPG
jgi:hypothetical protein